MGLMPFILSLSRSQVSDVEPTPLGFRRAITVDNTGAAGAQTDFPVRIELTSSNFDFSKTPGTNLRFTSDLAGQTDLSYWIEKWDGDNELATIWVKVASLPNNAPTTVYMFYGEPEVTNSSNGTNVFTMFENFPGGPDQHNLVGSDSGGATTFVPELRRFYFFGQDKAASTGSNIVQWVNIDTWEVGFVWPGLDTPVNGAAVIYCPSTQLIYVFGGRNNTSGNHTNLIQTFDPFTETFDTLSETIPTNLTDSEPVYDPESESIFLFGGTTATSTRSSVIYSFDPQTGDITDTTADLPTAATSIGGVYNPDDQLIYLFGGVWQNGMTTDNLDTILSYNPATPSTNPVNTGATLAEPTENQNGAYAKGAIYLFGGFRRTTATYKDIIQKYVPSTNARTTLAATMPRPDDDARAYYDSVTDRIYISPWLHSDQATDNSFHEKVIVNIFNPNTEASPVEPTLRTGPPSGWTSVGTDSRPPYHLKNCMLLDDDSAANSITAAKSLGVTLTSDIWMMEVEIELMDTTGRTFIFMYQDSTPITQIDDESNQMWQIRDGSNVFTNIANAITGPHWMGTLLDIGAERQYGLLNRANRTSARTLRGTISTGVNAVRIGTSSTGMEKSKISRVILRKCALIEPTQTVGAETEL